MTFNAIDDVRFWRGRSTPQRVVETEFSGFDAVPRTCWLSSRDHWRSFTT